MKVFEWLAQANREVGPARSVSEEERIWIDSGAKKVELLEPEGICNRQIVANSTRAPYPEESSTLSLPSFIANPPPKVIRLDEFEGTGGASRFELAKVNSVTTALQQSQVLAHMAV